MDDDSSDDEPKVSKAKNTYRGSDSESEHRADDDDDDDIALFNKNAAPSKFKQSVVYDDEPIETSQS